MLRKRNVSRIVLYGAVLLAAAGEDLMKQMTEMLVDEIGIDRGKIIAEYPVKFVETLNQ